MAPESKSARMVGRCGVLLPLALPRSYDYRIPESLAVAPGDFVRVPLGRRFAIGIVWDEGAGDIPDEKTKDIAARLDLPPLPHVLRQFVDRVARYYMAPPGAVLRMAMSVPQALRPEPPIRAWRLAEIALMAAEKLSPARRRVVEILRDLPSLPSAELARRAGASPGIVAAMAKAGELRAVEIPPPLPFGDPDPDRPGPDLSPAQQAAAAELVKLAPGVRLLDGVTGSGKTETYFEAIAAALKSHRQCLVLLPEIALTAQWLDRCEARFGAKPAQWHSELSPVERRRTWRAVLENRARLVVGARSALFLPFPDLGLIVVDEEHEGAFKQEDGIPYQARDMAVLRGHLAKIPVILASATPSLETIANVEAGRYRALDLPDRHGGAKLPTIATIDLTRDRLPRGAWLSSALRAAIGETLASGDQVLLFLNRRGYAPLTLCRACGHRLRCPNCSAWLVEHRAQARLECHHCGLKRNPPTECPSCQAKDALIACGPGIERLSEEAAELFPAARRLVLASDTLGGPIKAAALMRAIAAREVDLVIGTQILAKSHHFPHLTLVGIVDADLGLAGGDLRAAERSFQLLSQVAGRAGRGLKPGRVLIQTYDPRQPVMTALAKGDRAAFLAAEMADRRQAGMPPFGRLAAIILSGRDAAAVAAKAGELSRSRPQLPGVRILGPAPAPLSLLRGRHRQRFLAKADKAIPLQPILESWLGAHRGSKDVRIQIDIDPYGFL